MLLRMLAPILLGVTLSTALAQEDPESVYRKFHAAGLAGNYEEMRRYGTAAGAAQLAAMPAAQRSAMVKLTAAMLPKSYSITGRQISPDGNKATLRAVSNGDPQAAGTITLVKEGGAWKVESAKWGNP